MSVQSDDLRALMRHWPSGVTVVTATNPESNEPYGMTVSTFASLALEPPLISVFIHKDAETGHAILVSKGFGVSILRADQAQLSNRFAGYDPAFSEQAQRFEDLPVQYAESGSPLLSDALGWLDCRVWAVYDGATHHIVIGEVVALSPMSDTSDDHPLLYYNRGYRRLILIENDDV